MTSPTERALALVEHLCDLACEESERNVEAYEVADALRSAIRDIGASEWRGLDTVPAYPEAHEFLVWHASHGCAYIVEWYSAQLLQDDCGNPMDLAACSHWAPLTPPATCPLAWHPADSTELPPDWPHPPT